MVIHTLGYQGWKLDQLLQVLDVRDAHLVDIRYKPTSKAPQWRQAAFVRRLGERYHWLGQLGNINYRQPELQVVIADLDGGLAALQAMVTTAPRVVLLCGCADLARCHRLRVAQAIEARWKMSVVHLECPNSVTPKVLRNSPVQLPLLGTLPPGKPRGRPRLHASNAARQKSYRIRQKVKVYHRDKRSDWETPHALFADLDAEFHFTLDVCASQDNAKCARYFTVADDGLMQPWEGVCWMNPPYGRGVERWIRKAYESSLQGATVVCLVKSTTDTKWWHTYTPHAEVRWVEGRITFHGAPHPAPFSVCLVIFRPARNDTTLRKFVPWRAKTPGGEKPPFGGKLQGIQIVDTPML